jgi:serine/threonine protein kinase
MQEGHFATVWEGLSIETGRAHAIKVIKREGLTQLEDAAVMNEVSILRSLRHKNIVPLLDFFETPDRFCLVMEKCNGGDVLERVANIEHYTEKDACQFAKGFLEVREIYSSDVPR